jgi:hypothetical protein
MDSPIHSEGTEGGGKRQRFILTAYPPLISYYKISSSNKSKGGLL